MAKPMMYKNTGLSYLEGKFYVLFDNGVRVSRTSFETWDRSNRVLAEILKLEKDPGVIKYDYEVALTRNELVKLEPIPVADMDPVIEDASTADAMYNGASRTSKIVTQAPYSGSVKPTVKIPVAAPVLPPMKVEPAITPITYAETGIPEHGTIESALAPAAVIEIPHEYKIAGLADSVVPVENKKEKMTIARVVHSLHNAPIVMAGVITLIGFISLFVSGYHVFMFAADGGRPIWMSAIFGVTMPLFSAIAFTSGKFFGQNKGVGQKLVAGVFYTFGVMVILFAVFATMKVNFDQFKAGDETKIAKIVDTSKATVTLDTQKAAHKAEMDRIDILTKDNKAEINRLENVASKNEAEAETWKETSPYRYDTFTAAARTARSQQQTQRNQMAANQVEYQKQSDAYFGSGTQAVVAEDMAKKTYEDQSIYGLLHTVFGWEESSVKFIIYVIPAVFFDLVSPFALTVVMSMANPVPKRRKESEDADQPKNNQA